MNNNDDLPKRLRESGQAELDPARAATIRQSIISAFTKEVTTWPIQAAAPQAYRFLSKPMMAVGIIALILNVILGTSSIANAAKPGDRLYGWDTATEKVRLGLTIGAEAKASYQAKVAEERFQEQLELEKKDSEHAVEAATQADVALDHAIETVGEVKVKLEQKPGKGSESLTKVETRLKKLKEQHKSSQKKSDGKHGNSEDKPKNEKNDTNTNRHDNGEDVDPNTNRSNDDESSDEHTSTTTQTTIHVKVHRGDNATEISTVVAGKELQWELTTTSQSEILASIVAKTGLTSAAITSIWDYQQE